MVRIEKILFPTDFSEPSNHALPYAVALAATYGAKLYVLHVITLFEHDPYEPHHTFPDLNGYRKQIQAAAEAKTGEVAARISQGPGQLQVEKIVERGVAPYEIILDVAEREAVDLIVLATHGRSGLARFLLGSVTEKIIRFARCPVLVVKQHEHEFVDPQTGLLKLRTILVPIDFSVASERALHYGASLAEQFGAQLRLVHVLDVRINPSYYATGVDSIFQINPEMRDRLEHKLRDFAREIIAEHQSVEYVILEGKAHAEIDRYARKEAIDVIVMGTHGYEEIGDYLLGSTTERVVRHAPCPVLVTHQ